MLCFANTQHLAKLDFESLPDRRNNLLESVKGEAATRALELRMAASATGRAKP
jgi:hypothetical protein